jgi:N-acetylglucosaminyldiphosphoundecaprenol N-acetyl-beta-D-mannosaminyltransferase
MATVIAPDDISADVEPSVPSGIGGLPLWPLRIAFVGFPVWWLLGFAWAVWAVVSVLGLGVLVCSRNLRVPRGMWVYGLMLVGLLGSAFELHHAGNLKSYLYGIEGFVGGGVVCVYTYNTASPARTAARYAGIFGLMTIGGGLLGVVLPHFSYSPPGARILSSPFFHSISTVQFASVSPLSGANRPSAPFVYANKWGAVLGICLPVVVALTGGQWRRHRSLILLAVALSIVPIVFSLDRTLWVIVVLSVGYALVRAVRAGHGGAVLALLAAVGIVGVVLVATQLHSLIGQKFSNTTSGMARSAIYHATLTGFRASPLFGHGISGGDTFQGKQLAAAVGTQGQFWALLYDAGLIGTIPFYGFFVLVLWRTRQTRTSLAAGFRTAVAAGVIMSYYYALAPDAVVVMMMLCAGLLFETEQRRAELWSAAADELGALAHALPPAEPPGERRRAPVPPPAPAFVPATGPVISMFGVEVDVDLPQRLIARMVQRAIAGIPTRVLYVNAHVLNLAAGDRELRTLLASADIMLADGHGVTMAARILGLEVPRRAAVTDLIWDLGRSCAEERVTLFLVGGRPGVAQRAGEVLTARSPALQVVGTHHGYIDSPSVEDALIARVRAARPQVLCVGMGSPAQERWIAANAERLGVPCVVAVGAVMDFVSGEVSRPRPLWMSEHGLEWLSRLAAEPQRMWRRYLIGNPLFIGRTMREASRRRRSDRQP